MTAKKRRGGNRTVKQDSGVGLVQRKKAPTPTHRLGDLSSMRQGEALKLAEKCGQRKKEWGWKARGKGRGGGWGEKEIKKSKIELTGGRVVVISQSATENGRLKLRD